MSAPFKRLGEPTGATPEPLRTRVDIAGLLLDSQPLGFEELAPHIPPVPGFTAGGGAASVYETKPLTNEDLFVLLRQQAALLERFVSVQEQNSRTPAKVPPSRQVVQVEADANQKFIDSLMYNVSGSSGGKLTAAATKLRKRLHGIALSQDRIEKFTSQIELSPKVGSHKVHLRTKQYGN